MSSAAFKGNLIITNLPSEMTGDQLAELFEGFGMVIGAEIRIIPSMSGPATIGVVALAPESAVDRAIDAINHSMIGDRKVKVGRAKARPQKPKPSPAIKTASTRIRESFPPAAPAQPAKTVVIEYKPRRRLIAKV